MGTKTKQDWETEGRANKAGLLCRHLQRLGFTAEHAERMDDAAWHSAARGAKGVSDKKAPSLTTRKWTINMMRDLPPAGVDDRGQQ